MSFGEIKWFSFKSREEQKAQEEAYELWAFPHGQKQRDSIQALLADVFPTKKGTDPYALFQFLVCKELYEKALKSNMTDREVIDAIASGKKEYRNGIGKKDVPMYVALVQADANLSEECQYPTADEIRASAMELEKT